MNFIQSLITQSLQPPRKNSGQNIAADVTTQQSTPSEIATSNSGSFIPSDNLQNTILKTDDPHTSTNHLVDGVSVQSSNPVNTSEPLQQSNSIQQQEISHISEPSNPVVKPTSETAILPGITKPQLEEAQPSSSEKFSTFNNRSTDSAIENASSSHKTTQQTISLQGGSNEITHANLSSSKVSIQHKNTAEIKSSENSSTESAPITASAKRQDHSEPANNSFKTESISTASETSFKQQPKPDNGVDSNSFLQHAVAIAVEQKKVLPAVQKSHNKPTQQSSTTVAETPQVRIGQINVVVDNPSANKPARRSSAATSAHTVNPFGLRGL